MTTVRAEEARPHADDRSNLGKEIDLRIERGDEVDLSEEIGRVFGALRARVRGLCRYVLGSGDAADEALGEIYLKTLRAQALYDRRRPLAAWILVIARHHCLDLLRRRRVETRLFAAGEIDVDALPSSPPPGAALPSVSEPGHPPLARILARESREALCAAIEALPAKYRLPLVLRYYEELSYDEIARELDLTRQDVATLLFRAKQKLRGALAADTLAESP